MLANQDSFDQDNLHPYSLPPFANSKNKALSLAIRQKELNLQSLTATLDDNITRADTMRAHMKNVQQEYSHTQSLYEAKSRQIESEDHLKQVFDRQAGRYAGEIVQMESASLLVQEKITSIQTSIYKTTEQIETLRAELKFSKEELDDWIRVTSEKEDDTLALMKYSLEDSSKIKQLSLTMDKLMHQVQRKKAALNAEVKCVSLTQKVTDTQVSQIELDKTTQEFKRLHQERQLLISQWENAIKAMNSRDSSIQESTHLLDDLRGKLGKLQGIIEEKQQFLDLQVDNNNKTRDKIEDFDRIVGKTRIEHSKASDSLQQFQDQVDSIRNMLSKTATDLVNKRAEISNLKASRIEKVNRLEKEKFNRMEIKGKLVQITDTTMTMEAKAQAELFALKLEEKNMEAEITGGDASLKTLGSKITRLDQEALKQQALLYNQEFQIQQLERKVQRAEGDRTDEEKGILEQKIAQLNESLENEDKRFGLLNSQLKKAQDDLRHARRQLDSLVKDKERVTESIEELNLYNDSAAVQLNSKIKEKEDVMVEENILRLELRKLRGYLNSRADDVFTLESKQLYLQLALEERTREIQIHKDMMKVQIKNSEEERHSACTELRDRVKKVETLKRRYEILMSNFPEDDENTPSGTLTEDHSQAYYVIKASQKREELQREGDTLDGKIRMAEKEIKALENTLKMMNDRNEEYRIKAELNSKDVQHHEMLNDQFKQTMNAYKERREELQDLQYELANAEQALSLITSEEGSKMQSMQILQVKLSSIKKDIAEQEAKRKRAKMSYNKLSKEVEKKFGGADLAEASEEITDCKLREVRDKNNVLLTEAAKIVELYPACKENLFSALQQAGITIPTKPISRSGSHSNSNVSSITSSRSGSRASISRSVDHSRISTNASITSKTLVPAPMRSISTTELSGADSSYSAAFADPKPLDETKPTRSTGSLKRVSVSNTKLLTRSSRSNSQSSMSFDLPPLPKADLVIQGQDKAIEAKTPITGQDRIKRPARTGSNTSLSSRGSNISMNK